MIFDGIHISKTCTFDGCLQAEKEEKVCRSQIRSVTRVIKHSYNLLSHELAHTDSTVCRGIFVEQHPFSSPVQLWPNLPNILQQSVQNCLVKCSINGLTCRKKFLVDDAFVVKEGDQQCFGLGFLQMIISDIWNSVNTMPSIAFLIPDRTGSTRSHLP